MRIRGFALAMCLWFIVGCSVDDGVSQQPDPDPDPSRRAIVVDFIWEYEERSAANDFEWMVDRLHPGTFEFWSQDDCLSTLEQKRSYFNEVTALGSMEYYPEFSFDYGQGRKRTFVDAYRTETVSKTEQGFVEGVMTVAFVDGEPRWFSNCDSIFGF